MKKLFILAAPARLTAVSLFIAGTILALDREPLQAVPRVIADRGPLAAGERQTIKLFESASPSVVYITTLRVGRDRFSRNIFEIPQGAGSGFVWDDQGHVVTNFHVLRGAQIARVMLDDQSVWEAKLVGVSPDKDLAVLQIEAPRETLRAIPIGTSDDLKVGQKVLAIGNPFGFDHTLTTGIISGLGREIQSVAGRPIQDVIQTDAAINPGNSGGPLLDSGGRLIGVNTMIYSPSGVYAGVGFAVPVDTVNRVVPELIVHGKVVRPGLGVKIDDYLNERLGIEGVIVRGVLRRSAAERAGIKGIRWGHFGRYQLGDVIVAIDDEKISDSDDLFNILDKRKIGETVKVSLENDGRQREVSLELQAID